MSLLHDHFARLAVAQAQSLPIIRGVFYDVGWTLVREKLNRPLIEFAIWNNEKKLIPDNHIFSGDIDDACDMLAREKFDTSTIGVDELVYKQRTYNAAFDLQCMDNIHLKNALSTEDRAAFVPRQSHCLELVVDDAPPYKDGINGLPLVLTWWDPGDKAVQKFLEDKEYLDFRL